MPLADVRPLAPNLPFGLRIGGLTREMLDDPAIRKELDDLFIERGLILFEQVEESDAMQLALSQVFGPLKEHPVKAVARVDGDRMPGVIEIRSEPGRGIIELEGRRVSHWQPWHFDHCYNNELNRAGILRSLVRTEQGGVTSFMDGIALYNALPRNLVERIAGKEVAYTLSTQYDQLKFGKPAGYRVIEPKPSSPEFIAQALAQPRALHPAVWTRPTGEKVLHVSSYMAQGIAGEQGPDSDALLEEVCQAINAQAATCAYHHKWRAGDMVIWDNLRMLHCVSGNDPEAYRLMYRTTIAGDYGFGHWEGGAAQGAEIDAMA